MTILRQDPDTGYWNLVPVVRRVKPGSIIDWRVEETGEFTTLRTHSEPGCKGRLCDVHNRRGTGPQATWPLNWRSDRGIMEVICPCGIAHPTPAQAGYLYWLSSTDQIELSTADAELVHGCCVTHCPNDYTRLETVR